MPDPGRKTERKDRRPDTRPRVPAQAQQRGRRARAERASQRTVQLPRAPGDLRGEVPRVDFRDQPPAPSIQQARPLTPEELLRVRNAQENAAAMAAMARAAQSGPIAPGPTVGGAQAPPPLMRMEPQSIPTPMPTSAPQSVPVPAVSDTTFSRLGADPETQQRMLLEALFLSRLAGGQ